MRAFKKHRWPLPRARVAPASKPEGSPPLVEAFGELGKKSIENSIDFLKYIATASGVTIGFYANLLRDYVNSSTYRVDTVANLILISPVVLWLSVIFISIYALFPRTYVATTDAAKEQAVAAIRKRLRKSFSVCGIAFSIGFLLLVILMICYLWKLYPMNGNQEVPPPKAIPVMIPS